MLTGNREGWKDGFVGRYDLSFDAIRDIHQPPAGGLWPGPVGRSNLARSSQVALSAAEHADDCRRGGRKGRCSILQCRGTRLVLATPIWILFPVYATADGGKTTGLHFVIGFPYRVCYIYS